MKRHFLIYFFTAFVVGAGCITGCGPRLTPVSSSDTTSTTSDSIALHTSAHRDSSVFRETVEQKTLTGATVGATLTRPQLDSLLAAIAAMPSSVQRTMYFQDPDHKVQMRILFDSLGRVRLECQAMDRTYFERNVQQIRFIEQLSTELTRINKENKELKSKVLQLDKSITGRLLDWADRFSLYICLGVIFIALGWFALRRFAGNSIDKML